MVPAFIIVPLFLKEPKLIAASAGELRADTIKNFMYLISAPFLAVGVYYLLQLLADSVSTPVLVVMAFATGLNSDKIVEAIAKAAEDHLPGSGDDDEDKESQKKKRGDATDNGGGVGLSSDADDDIGSDQADSLDTGEKPADEKHNETG